VQVQSARVTEVQVLGITGSAECKYRITEVQKCKCKKCKCKCKLQILENYKLQRVTELQSARIHRSASANYRFTSASASARSAEFYRGVKCKYKCRVLKLQNYKCRVHRNYRFTECTSAEF
jgi:hypothetical protein